MASTRASSETQKLRFLERSPGAVGWRSTGWAPVTSAPRPKRGWLPAVTEGCLQGQLPWTELRNAFLETSEDEPRLGKRELEGGTQGIKDTGNDSKERLATLLVHLKIIKQRHQCLGGGAGSQLPTVGLGWPQQGPLG